jgi:hypothetical protein
VLRDRTRARARVSALDANARRRTNIDQYTIPNVVVRTLTSYVTRAPADATPRHTMALDAELDAAIAVRRARGVRRRFNAMYGC